MSKKNDKNLQKLSEAGRIEDFEYDKSYHTSPEYPGYDIKIPPQHRVSDPLKIYIFFKLFNIKYLKLL